MRSNSQPISPEYNGSPKHTPCSGHCTPRIDHCILHLLEIVVSIEDTIAYTQPLKGRFYFKKDRNLEITEYNCDGMFDYRPYTPKK
jgi:hypothetical protein